jgi:enoyl-CoA hydratase/carnithine racemase
MTEYKRFETLSLEAADGLMVISFNRPEKRNAINRRMHQELQELCRLLDSDQATRVVIFKGAGSCFSSGADTSEWRVPGSAKDLEVRALSGIGGETSDAIDRLGQVTIAAVHGYAIGGALVLALCCDIRLAEESAWFSIPEVELGLPLGWNALPRLAREIGHSRALELTLTCDRFSSGEALAYGLVSRVTDDGAVDGEARTLAAKVLSRPALPVSLTKATMKAIRAGSEMGRLAYSDGDLLLYARLMAQRASRLEKEGRD